MLKTMTIIGTRPELIKMSRVIPELDQHTHHILVHTGQNFDYELNKIFFDDLAIRKPDYFLDVARETAAQTIAQIIQKTDELFATEMPQALLLYGDTNSCLSIIAAKKRKIPIFHMEAGNRCFDQRVPEEINRKIVDHLADVNLVLTEHARRYLISEGIRPETIIKTGSHMTEVLDYYMPQILDSDIVTRLNLTENQYFLVSAHREENVDCPRRLQILLNTLEKLHQHYQYPIIISTHPRTRKKLEALAYTPISEGLIFLNPFPFSEYIRLALGAFCILSDSGTITEEASILNLPAITIRDSHERPEGMDVGTVLMTGLNQSRVLDAVEVVVAQHSKNSRRIQPVTDYEIPLVSKKIVRIVLSYVDYIKHTVWRESSCV